MSFNRRFRADEPVSLLGFKVTRPVQNEKLAQYIYTSDSKISQAKMPNHNGNETTCTHSERYSTQRSH